MSPIQPAPDLGTQPGKQISINELGKTSIKKKRFLSGIARITPIRATWSSFFGRQKRCFVHMTEFFLMMIMMVAMIIMIIMIILMIFMTKMTKNIQLL